MNKKIINENDRIDIRPNTDIFAIFKKIPYTTVSCINEFIDNSTGSYINISKNENLEIFEIKKEINRKIGLPQIDIIHDSDSNKLIVSDNAFGISDYDISRLFKLNNPPKNNMGRNEFGMGLKQAGFWLGDKIEVFTRRTGDEGCKYIFADLNNLKTNNSIIDVHKEGYNVWKNNNRNEKGTTIVISFNLKKITKTQHKLWVEKFSSHYRWDIKNFDLEIRVIQKKGGEYFCLNSNIDSDISILKIENAMPLVFRDRKFRCDENGNEYKININVPLINDDKKLTINGFVGLLEKGDRLNAGFALLRRGRIIIENYRPNKIFGNSGSFEYQRIYGELSLDNFEVDQQKTNFDWEGDLENIFIDLIISEIKKVKFGEKDLIKIAKTARYKNNDDKLDNQKIKYELEKNMIPAIGIIEGSDSIVKMDEDEVIPTIIIKKNKDNFEFKFRIILDNEEFKYEDKWFLIEKIDDKNYIYDLKIKMDHPLFYNINDTKTNIAKVISYILSCFAYTEIKANLIQDYTLTKSRENVNALMSEYIKGDKND